ncbi:MAG: 50S ribosomal protein L28 [Anaerolineaceae bacterium]|nr:50S ribosomal protein L28 [Anaerolineaceae bacterium]
MASRRSISTVKPQFGNNRSHSLKATRRQFRPNYQNKRLWVPELDRFVRVRLTAKELRTIDKIGLREFMARQGRKIEELV